MLNIDLLLIFLLQPDSICWPVPELAGASFKLYSFTDVFTLYSFLEKEEHVEALTSAARTPPVFSLIPFHLKNILSQLYRNSNIWKLMQNIYNSDTAWI